MSTSAPPTEDSAKVLVCNTVLLNKQYYTTDGKTTSDNIKKALESGTRSGFHFYAGLIASICCIFFLILAFTVQGGGAILIYSCLTLQTVAMAFTGYRYYINKKHFNEATKGFLSCEKNPELDKKK